MRRQQRKPFPARLKAHNIRGAVELLGGVIASFGRQHNLPCQTGRHNSTLIINECQSFAISLRSRRHIADNQTPIRPQKLFEQKAYPGCICLYFLYCNDIEFFNNLCNVNQRSQVPLRAALCIPPGTTDPPEIPDVPATDQQVFVDDFLGNIRFFYALTKPDKIYDCTKRVILNSFHFHPCSNLFD